MREKLQKIKDYIKSIDCSRFKASLKCRRKDEKVKRTAPFPLIKLVAINSNVFVNQLGVILVFPFLPFMIHDFFTGLKRSQLGQQAGFLGAAYFIGNLPGTIILGLLSDYFGRKWVLLLATLIGTSFEILFGFSQNFGWALTARTIWGFIDGNVGVAKAFISEVCTAADLGGGFAIYGASHAMGRVTGSIIGGILARPASKYKPFELPFFCDFPYVLPCFVGAGLGVVTFIIGSIFIREKRKKKNENNEKNSIIFKNSRDHPPLIDQDSDTAPLLELKMKEADAEEADEDRSDGNKEGLKKRVTNFLTELKPKAAETGKACKGKTLKVLRQLIERDMLIANIFFTTLSYVTIVTIELLPLLLVNTFVHGGYEMDDTEIGIIMMLATLAHLPVQLIIFPWLMILIGYRHTFRVGLIILFVCNFFIPFSTAIAGHMIEPPGYNVTYLNLSAYCNDTTAISQIRTDSVTRISWNVWLWMIFINGLNIAGRGIIIGTTAVFINNASYPSVRGTINGVSQSISSIGKMFAPLIGAPLFAWSETNRLPFPINFHFVFNLNCIIIVIIFFVSFVLSRRLEEPRKEDNGQSASDGDSDTDLEEYTTGTEDEEHGAKNFITKETK